MKSIATATLLTMQLCIATSSKKFLLKTDALAALKAWCSRGNGFKGLDVCNSLERDKACWRCCLQLAALMEGKRALQAPVQFIATKLGEEAHAEYLAASAIM